MTSGNGIRFDERVRLAPRRVGSGQNGGRAPGAVIQSQNARAQTPSALRGVPASFRRH